MSRLRRNEWNFSAVAATAISDLLQRDPEFAGSPLGHAEPELTELQGARRLDLVIFARENRTLPLVTGELKVPWNPEGRSPHASALVESAHGKASRAGARYFITWNIRRVVVWKTDDPGVELQNRAVYDSEMVPVPIRSQEDLDALAVRDALARGIRGLVEFLTSVLTGPPTPAFLPLDRLFIARLESALDYPIDAAFEAISARASASAMFKAQLERWMREGQGWLVTKHNFDENVERAARFASYVLVNRLCFYNALRKKYNLPRLRVADDVASGAQLQERLEGVFNEAMRDTGDYETVFDGDFGDRLPFLSDESVPEWRSLIRQLDRYDFATVPLDVIGAMYEQLIRPEERHRYGQHYTQPSVVDLINSFAIRDGMEAVFDPGCGGGTFLVRSYVRKSYLAPAQTHTDLIASIYGCDILAYACHLSTINLAIRDLIDDDNFPRIHHGDFLRLMPGRVFCEHPVRQQAGGRVVDREQIRVPRNYFDSIVGNPPYISARVLTSEARERYNQVARKEWAGYDWSPSADIYTYFWTHSTAFLRPSGMLVLITQAAWLDVEYGIPVQQWMLQNFRIIAVLESEAEPWFTDARVATAVTVLQREADAEQRGRNTVRFVQFRHRLEALLGAGTDAQRLAAADALRDQLTQIETDADVQAFRARVFRQADLEREGQDRSGAYVGDKWGRYLRSTNCIYELQKQRRIAFVEMQDLATVRRGITTNCDDFFLVTDVTVGALDRFTNEQEFRAHFGVSRRRVAGQNIAVVRRSDGVEHALEREYLSPIIKTARDFRCFATSRIDRCDLAVLLPDDRTSLSELAERYVRAGEREGWHRTPSFQNLRDRNWFTLRVTSAAPLLFIKTMQYTPVVLLNDGGMLANQRLYEMHAADDIDVWAFAATLNSTIFAAERYAGVKALGREAAIDVEVFTAKKFRTPDVRHLRKDGVRRLGALMRDLCGREAGPILEEALIDTTLTAAQRYIDAHPVTPDLWPAELRDETRQAIDRLLLEAIGTPAREARGILTALYNEMIAYTRKLRRLELEAQLNRQSGGSEATNVRDLAQDVWTQLSAEGLNPIPVPDGFLDRGVASRRIQVPAGRAELVQPGLFDSEAGYAVRVGDRSFRFDTQAERDYFFTLASMGVRGETVIPVSVDDCIRLAARVREYIGEVRRGLDRIVYDLTSDQDLQHRIIRECMRRVLQG